MLFTERYENMSASELEDVVKLMSADEIDAIKRKRREDRSYDEQILFKAIAKRDAKLARFASNKIVGDKARRNISRVAAMKQIKKKLEAAGIRVRYKNANETALDVYNKISIAHPIYSVVVAYDRFGNSGIKLVDSSATGMNHNGFTDLVTGAKHAPDPDMMSMRTINSRNVYNKYLRDFDYLSVNGKSVDGPYNAASTYYKLDNGNLGVKHYRFTGDVIHMNTNNVVWFKKSQEYLYLEYEGGFDNGGNNAVIKVTHIDGSNIRVEKCPTKAQIKRNFSLGVEWDTKTDEYKRDGVHLDFDESIEFISNYIIDTIDTTTVNAAEKSGKLKYKIKPMEALFTALLRNKNIADVESNISEVCNTNAEQPYITFKLNSNDGPVKGVLFKITVAKLGKNESIFKVSNIDKTILYADIKRNIEAINDSLMNKVISVQKASVNDPVNKLADSIVADVTKYIASIKDILPVAIRNKSNAISFSKIVHDQNKEAEARQKIEDAKAVARAEAEAEADRIAHEQELARHKEEVALRKQYNANKKELLKKALVKPKMSSVTDNDINDALAELGI